MGGARYTLVEDDFSRMVFVYFLKSKDEVFNKFIEFKNLVENQTEEKKSKFSSLIMVENFVGEILKFFLRNMVFCIRKRTHQSKMDCPKE